ncbi:hypothetical protein D3C72_1821270 [compost metagenome]
MDLLSRYRIPPHEFELVTVISEPVFNQPLFESGLGGSFGHCQGQLHLVFLRGVDARQERNNPSADHGRRGFTHDAAPVGCA